MAYQNVGTPRFYIDYLTYWKSIGFIDQEKITNNPEPDYDPNRPSFLGLDPTTPKIIWQDGNKSSLGVKIYLKGFIHYEEIATYNDRSGFIAFLGHSLNNKPTYPDDVEATPWGEHLLHRANWDNDDSDMDYSEVDHAHPQSGSTDSYTGWHPTTMVDPINSYIVESVHGNILEGGGFSSFSNQGFSIFRTNASTGRPYSLLKYLNFAFTYQDDDGVDTYNYNFNFSGNLNSISAGKVYDMPHSPELDVTMTIENDGFDSITTQGGSHLTNIRYNGAPMWNINGVDVPPWTIGEPTTIGRRRGRRVWSLNFKHLAGKDLFMANYSSGMYRETSANIDADEFQSNYNGEEIFAQNLNNDDSFFGRVLNYVGNGCRFIFQPDGNNNNPDQFAICQLDQDSLNIKQVANGVYSISLKIREVW